VGKVAEWMQAQQNDQSMTVFSIVPPPHCMQAN